MVKKIFGVILIIVIFAGCAGLSLFLWNKYHVSAGPTDPDIDEPEVSVVNILTSPYVVAEFEYTVPPEYPANIFTTVTYIVVEEGLLFNASSVTVDFKLMVDYEIIFDGLIDLEILFKGETFAISWTSEILDLPQSLIIGLESDEGADTYIIVQYKRPDKSPMDIYIEIRSINIYSLGV